MSTGVKFAQRRQLNIKLLETQMEPQKDIFSLIKGADLTDIIHEFYPLDLFEVQYFSHLSTKRQSNDAIEIPGALIKTNTQLEDNLFFSGVDSI